MDVIILEGSDCAGKSTFAGVLSERLNYKVLRGSSFEISELGADGMFNYMMELLDNENVVIDRFFYSNLVYGKLFDYPMMSENQYEILINKMNSRALLIYLYAPEETIKHRMNSRGDDMIKVENISDILKGYGEELYGKFKPEAYLKVDTSIVDMNDVVIMVEEIIDEIGVL